MMQDLLPVLCFHSVCVYLHVHVYTVCASIPVYTAIASCTLCNTLELEMTNYYMYVSASMYSLMKESQMLVSKCVILNVIKATTSQPTLTRCVRVHTEFLKPHPFSVV